MRKLIITAVLTSTFLASPALARDGAAYFGLEAGLMKPRAMELRLSRGNASIGDAVRLRHKLGYDIGALAGYDFGMFRLEGELAYKSSSITRESVAPAAAAAVAGVPGSFDADGRTSVLSGMLNGLVDFGIGGLSASAGLGLGLTDVTVRADSPGARLLNFRSHDSSAAWQALAEVRGAVSDNLDLGLRYRYFETRNLDFGPFCRVTCGAVAPYDLRGSFRSHSLLATLAFNFGAVAAAPLPPPPPPAPVAPATVTCPDGSVVPAGSACPAPPPPPPPPPPPVERGERGE